MGKIILAGIGIAEGDLSLRLIETAKKCDKVYAESYTSAIPQKYLDFIESAIGRKIALLQRSDLEERSSSLMKEAGSASVMVLVPGDPMLFTTHSSLVIEAKKKGIQTEILHGISIISAAMSASGLQASKFGRTVTLPSRFNKKEYDHILKDVEDNSKRGLHTLVLIELDLSFKEAISRLPKQKLIALSRIGGENEIVKYGDREELSSINAEPPSAVIVPGKLHFQEKEFLDSL